MEILKKPSAISYIIFRLQILEKYTWNIKYLHFESHSFL